MGSKKNNDISRRTFIVGVSTGVVGATCTSKKRDDEAVPRDDGKKVVSASPKEACAALCLIVGPWTIADRAVAEEFLGRFLSARRMKKFSKHAEAIASLPSHLPNAGSGRLDKIPLANLSPSEKDALFTVVDEIYSIEEVRYYVSGEPDGGICMGDVGFIATVPT